jgi:membrane protease YdiL (CAAX protease family)
MVGTWPSSALTVVVGTCLAASLIKVPLTKVFAAGIAVPFLAVLVEEILFRPVLITCLHDSLTRTRTSWALAVVLSATIWTVVHMPSKSASMLVGLFVAGVVVGALYAWSGTNVAGYVLHALANSGSGGAVIMFVLCLVLGAGGRLIERRTGRDLRRTAKRTNNSG